MGKSQNLTPAPRRTLVRCAIYTRKSSEEGLEQAFNSLDAQREACEAFVLSQKQEGWTALPQMYDDGGISGGTMDRPALTRLLADIAAGLVDTVVVYKVDRLTRSLGDFAKIVEVFDRAHVAFVSVTQQFNTTTSMGRLTLNMLLSFAQFEREVTGERIRDKIAASKQKGMWMGGTQPLGYDVRDRKLVVNEEEADTVRRIFRLYAELGSVQVLKQELDRAGTVSKGRTDKFGRATGGQPIGRGSLYLMLQNRLYRGKVVHKDRCFPGEHQAIVDGDLWDRVQARLDGNRVERQRGGTAAVPSLLVGLLFDAGGERLTPTHANKKGTRYRYYVSQSLIAPGPKTGIAPNATAGWRLPARDIEALVEGRVQGLLADEAALFALAEARSTDVNERRGIVRAATELAGRWPRLETPERRAMLGHLIERIVVRQDVVEIAIRPTSIATLIEPGPDRRLAGTAAAAVQEHPRILTVPARLQRTGMETRLLIDAPGVKQRRAPDRSMLRLLAQARRFNAMVLRGNGASVGDLAAEAGVSSSYFTRILKLSFLAPGVVRAILDHDHPPGLTAAAVAEGRLAERVVEADQHAARGLNPDPKDCPFLRNLRRISEGSRFFGYRSVDRSILRRPEPI